MSLLGELQRRKVIRVAGVYLVASWLLLQIGDVTFDFLEIPDWAGKLLIAFLALGFIPAILFSWAYEITPEGIKKESEVDRSQSVTAQTGRKLDYITIVLLVVAVGLLGVDRLVFERGEDAVPTPQVVAADVATRRRDQTDSRTAAICERDRYFCGRPFSFSPS